MQYNICQLSPEEKQTQMNDLIRKQSLKNLIEKKELKVKIEKQRIFYALKMYLIKMKQQDMLDLQY